MARRQPNLPRRARFGGRVFRTLLIPFATILPVINANAQQQEGDTLVLGRREKRPWLHLDPAQFTLELWARYDASRISTSGTTDDASTWTFEETIEASTTGYIVHPNLVELSLAGRFGLAQRFFDGDTALDPAIGETQRTDQQDDTVAAWDAHATLFRRQTAPLTLYTTRTQQYISRNFGPTLENTNTTYGLRWDINLKQAPQQVHLIRREDQQDDPFGNQGFTVEQNTFEWGGTYILGPSRTLSWDYSFNDVTQSGQSSGSSDFQTNNATLSYNDEFGAKKQNSLYSTLEYRQQSGDFALEQFRFDNFLRLRHTERFETEYTYNFSQDDIAESERTAHRATARFRHRLYESLVTTGNVGGELNDFEGGGSSETYFANLSFDYAKKVPRGRLSANLTLAANYQTDDARTEPLVIVDEPHTFQDPVGITLTRQRIAPRSIRVTDAAGIFTYRENIDYQVVPFDTRTELRRIPTGLIPPAGAVLVDYALLPEPASETTTTSIAAGLRHDWTEGPLKGLAVYGRTFLQNQDISSARSEFFVPDNVTDFLAGAEYRGLRDLTLTAEYQWHDSEIDPYNAARLSARYARRIGMDTTLSATANYTTIDYEDPDNTVDLFVISAELEHRFSRSLRARLTVLYRDEQDDLLGDTTGTEQLLDLSWKHRQTEIFVLLRNATYETDAQDSDFQFFQFGLRRRF